MESSKGIVVNGIVSKRDMQPYLQLMDENGVIFAQLTMAQVQSITLDMQVMAARTEADAMIYQFFDKQEYPRDAASALIVSFRDFRRDYDAERVERFYQSPEGEKGEDSATS
jgi:hypothetical protein